MFGFEERGYGSQPRSGARMQSTAHAVRVRPANGKPQRGGRECFLAQTDWPGQSRVTQMNGENTPEIPPRTRQPC
jgi:hypothetical protein